MIWLPESNWKLGMETAHQRTQLCKQRIGISAPLCPHTHSGVQPLGRGEGLGIKLIPNGLHNGTFTKLPSEWIERVSHGGVAYVVCLERVGGLCTYFPTVWTTLPYQLICLQNLSSSFKI